MTYPPTVKPVADCEGPEISQLPGDNTKAEKRSDAKTPENTPSMLDVHPPHEALHTWKGFFIHIATIVVGLFIAVALEQSVEAIIRHHEAASLRKDLGEESRQILADARSSEAAHVYETR
jgi:demethoxyubiquinone hydroxylase (CLK1/Coq7/Cat5 family)